jgi:O-antigen ligase
LIFFYLLVSVLPLMRHPIWSAFVGDLTVIKYVGVGSLAYAVLYLGARRRRPRFFASAQSRWFVALSLLALASYAAWGMPIYAFEASPWLSYVSFLLFFFITLTVVDSTRRLRTVLLVAIGSVGFASAHVVREWQKYGGFGSYRPGYVTGDANYYSVSALLCVPLAFYLIGGKPRGWERWFCGGCLALTILGLTAAASRGALLGLTATMLFACAVSRQRARMLRLAFGVLVPLLLVSPSSPLPRLLSPDHSDQESTDTRLALWRAGLRMVRAHPLTGVGLGNFKWVVADYDAPGENLNNVAHNTYVEVAAELGLPGFALYVGLLATTYRALGRVRRQTRAVPAADVVHRAALGLQAGLVGFLVAIFFVSATQQKLFWLAVFLAMCLPALARQAERRPGAETPAAPPGPPPAGRRAA